MIEMAAPIAGVGLLQWLAFAGALACVALVAAMLVQGDHQVRMRRLVGIGRTRAAVIQPPGLDLGGISLSPIDRVFPRAPVRFLMLVATVSLGAWVGGYLLAPNPADFLASAEWLVQPFYIAAHLVALRLFINVFTRNYAAGIAELDVSRTHALRGIRPILGTRGALAAVAIAMPFCWSDFRYLSSPRYTRLGRDEIVRAADYVMWGIWSLEWCINAFIWVLLVGFMVKNCMTIARFPFRSPIHVVLQDKLYRPFLQMSAQGATVVLCFSLITVIYIYFTGGEITDYLGLGITIALLLVCFVPPWLVLRAKVDRAVRIETARLRQGAQVAAAATPVGLASHGAPAPGIERPLEARLDEALALLRIWHLQSLHGDLGQTEAKAVLLRLLAPAATIGWQVAHNYGDLAGRLVKMIGPAMGL